MVLNILFPNIVSMVSATHSAQLGSRQHSEGGIGLNHYASSYVKLFRFHH
jgi:hypothetical protein